AQGAWLIAVRGHSVLFEHDVRIDPSEAEGIHSRPTRRVWIGVNPGASRRVKGKGALGMLEQWMRLLRVEGRRYNAVVQRQSCLDQSGHAAGRHGMADHR